MQTTLYLNQWLTANGRQRQCPSDRWYFDFARQLLTLLHTEPAWIPTPHEQVQSALRLTLYFQDVIAQSGGWCAFVARHQALYGKRLPFYRPDPERFVDDEINREEIAYLLWAQRSRPADAHRDYTLCNPLDETLLRLSNVIYDRMDALFEEAPICPTASPDGWVPGYEALLTPATPLPQPGPQTRLSRDAERCLAHSGGYPLLYFPTYEALHRFFLDTLQWESPLEGVEQERDFVIYANAKGILLAPGVASCFCDTRNPAYDANLASQAGIDLFCRPGACPFDLLKYAMNHGLLPDARLPFPQGRELLHADWDFLARYYLNEYYEGK